jgi:hypothetical protein
LGSALFAMFEGDEPRTNGFDGSDKCDEDKK